MRKIFIVSYPDGKQLAYSSFDIAGNALINTFGLEVVLGWAKELRDEKPNQFKKTEYIPFKKEINGYKIESMQLITGGKGKI
jgi:hypothetical protein